MKLQTTPVKKLLSILVLISLTIGISHADGLFKSQPYIGLGLGFELNNGEATYGALLDGNTVLNQREDLKDFGYVTSAFLGYFKVLEVKDFYFGVTGEFFLDHSNASETRNFIFSQTGPDITQLFEVKGSFLWSYGFKGRLGLLFEVEEDRELFPYFTLGFKSSKLGLRAVVRTETDDSATNSTGTFEDNTFMNALVLGLGVEGLVFTCNHRIGFEVLYDLYESKRIDGIADGNPQSLDIKPRNWQFVFRYVIPLELGLWK